MNPIKRSAFIWAGLLFVQLGNAAFAQTNVFPTSGNVGIGTTSPAALLHLAGNNTTKMLLDNGVILSQKNAAGSIRNLLTHYSDDNVYLDDPDGSIFLRTPGAGDIIFQTTGMWAERMRITNAGNVGIGTASPSGRLTVTGTAGDGRSVTLDSREVKFRGDGISHMSIFGPTDGKPYLSIGDSSSNYLPGTQSTEAFVVHRNGNVGIGTTNPTYPLSINGTVRAKEVIVDTGWSDYVFADDYKLKPLSEVEQQIKANRHLPGIPSAKDVSEKGISVGEMQAKLLAKIEELTLHQIEQEKRLDAQQTEIAALKKENTLLRR